jgi:glycosyltransferase involved in cell wall biosynthesis
LRIDQVCQDRWGNFLIMKILIFHPVLLPPKDYGGVERVVLWLARGLMERGHEVWVAAREGSLLPAGVRLLPVAQGQESASELTRRIPIGVDVVHFMAPPEAEAWGRLPCAGILTIHGNGKLGEKFPLNSVFLSRDHAMRHNGEVFVYNGIDPAEYRFLPKARKQDWFLFLSKTSWSVKNLKGAIRICAKLKEDLHIAGGQRPWSLRFEALFRGMKWEGPVAGMEKAAILSQAKALLFPVVWPEPFGLVVAEALISGTPVVASRKGSLSELLSSDVGVTLDPPITPEALDAWVGFLSNPLPWEAERCRAWALEKFHYSKMAEGYEALYKKVIQNQTLHNEPPVAGDWRVQ